MARSDRTSICVMDNDVLRCLDDNTKTSESRVTKTKVIKTPPIAPRKFSLGSNSSPPPARVKSRRNSDSVSFITSPTVSPSVYRNSLVNMANDRKPDREGDGWVTSPVFANYSPGARQRKVSVFDGNLGSVKEIHEHDNGDNEAVYEDISEQNLSNSFDNSMNDEKDVDYACPMDAVKEDGEQNIYENPLTSTDRTSSPPGSMIGSKQQRYSDSNMKYGGYVDNNSHSEDIFKTSLDCQGLSKRKLSLGVILRKISTGSLQAGKRKASLQEKRLSSAFTKLISFPSLVKNNIGESYQVDSSSWEFLNTDISDSSNFKNNDCQITEHQGREFRNNKHPSKDSVYESEYDSSSTLESSSSSSSTNKAIFIAENTVYI